MYEQGHFRALYTVLYLGRGRCEISNNRTAAAGSAGVIKFRWTTRVFKNNW